MHPLDLNLDWQIIYTLSSMHGLCYYAVDVLAHSHFCMVLL